MKKLFLLRHANAEQSPDNDFNRALTLKGLNKCADVAKILEEYIGNIDIILSSSSFRTTQTIEAILTNLNSKKIVTYKDSLYHCSEYKILDEISKIPSECNNLLIVNHNPTISRLAMLLLKSTEESSMFHNIMAGFSETSLALFNINKNNWHLTEDLTEVKLDKFWR